MKASAASLRVGIESDISLPEPHIHSGASPEGKTPLREGRISLKKSLGKLAA
jgi:hypothetical protein